jgi:hypothetical protein
MSSNPRAPRRIPAFLIGAVALGCGSGAATSTPEDRDDCATRGAVECVDNGGAGGATGAGGAMMPAPGPSGGSGGGVGGSATGGAPHSTGGSSTNPIPTSRPYDPDESVSFEWPEVTPNGGKSCQAGRYAGTFSCNFVPAGADAGAANPFAITGPIEITLLETANGEFLEVSGGTLTGAALIAITFTAKVTGTLDCSTGQFDGQVYDGSYGIQPFPPGGFFEGPTTATYSPNGPSLVNGTWNFTVLMTDGTEQGRCIGTWTAALAP